MNIEVNYFAVILAGVASMAVGFLWYSPALFGKIWMKEKGLSSKNMKSAQKDMGKLYGISFIANLVTAYVLSHVISLSQNFYEYPALSTGLNSAFWMWFGFVMPVQLTATIFSNKNWQLFKIDTGYQLAALVLMGFVLVSFPRV